MAKAVHGTRVPNSQTIPDPLIPTGASDSEFLEWEQEWLGYQKALAVTGRTDDEMDQLSHEQTAFEQLIFQTPSVTPRAAEIKARLALQYVREDQEEDLIAPLEHILASLKQLEFVSFVTRRCERARNNSNPKGASMPNTDPAADPGLPKKPRPEPIEIVDRLDALRNFVECAFLAAGGLQRDASAPLQAVLEHVSDGLRDLAEDVLPGSAHAGEPGDEAEGDANG